ncbi:NAD(P)/FAD-dependent oxidoreductase [Nocardioides sp. MAH-18]|uniref:NAD(P)/FAD-dependent oxidoreductase n=1 Tax=Nocardioides agri TaxID=2682843 RepID=A0A6L6XQ31_9ACTN|nr:MULTISPECIES: FAD/NAD(P)-binding oxidoreductase [unclassified Nocardioides]MBA2953811.1 NAD(P)/FAD-dependent oxidoreductase [Nocardioides sp. CGMCC 1.13656]MVQ48676.1 NAD(P)/FAD-dependent oxidoreductase [Nocardioides sp. MAH-18]
MSGADGVVVVGGSVAGIRTARALREQGYDGPVRVVEAEAEVPYDKPPLSKGSVDADACVPLITLEEAEALGIELVLRRRAVALDADRRRLTLDDGNVLSFDHLVVATGLTPRRAPYDVEGVLVLRTLADSRALREAIARSQQVLVIGAGFIGAEVASLARRHGVGVTLVDPEPVPMGRVVGTELGGRFAALHRRHGVDTRFGSTVTSLVRVGDGYRVLLSDGDVVAADAVVVGIGSEVNVGWLAGSGLLVDDGVVCDERGAALRAPGIHAVGDAARWAGVRVEHWTSAVDQAVCVARSIAHPDEPAAPAPPAYVWSDQYDWKIQLVGDRDVARLPEVVEEAEPFRLAATWHDAEGRITGGVTVNWPRESVRMRAALARGGAA